MEAPVPEIIDGSLCRASNGRTINEQRFGKDVEGRHHGLTTDTTLEIACRE
jgi:hypothetical protein